MRGSGPGPTVTSAPWATVWSAVGFAPGGPAVRAPSRFVSFVAFRITWQTLGCNWSLSLFCNAISCLSCTGNVSSYFSFNFLNMDVGGLPGLLARFPTRGWRTVAERDHRDTFRSWDIRESGDWRDFAVWKLIGDVDHGVRFGLASFPLSRWSRWTSLSGWRPRSVPGSWSWSGSRSWSRIGQRSGSSQRPTSRPREASWSWIRPGPAPWSGLTGCVGSRVGQRGPPSPPSWRMVLIWGGAGCRTGSSGLSFWRHGLFTLWQERLLRFVLGALLLALFTFGFLLLSFGFLLLFLLLAALAGPLGAAIWGVFCRPGPGPGRVAPVVPSAWGMVSQSVKSKDTWSKKKKNKSDILSKSKVLEHTCLLCSIARCSAADKLWFSSSLLSSEAGYHCCRALPQRQSAI